MRAFVINLDSATDRWAFIQNSFKQSEVVLQRVPAVDVKDLVFPHPEFAEHLYRWFHGRTVNPRELACYLSHLKAIRAFLATGENHGMIAEDDIVLRPGFDSVLAAALRHSRSWNILRLSGLSCGFPVRIASLCGDYTLCINLTRLKGAGAYVTDRYAAATLLAHLRPMRLPYDHAIDREWCWGPRAAYVQPFPVSQSESPFLSSVQPGIYPKLSRTHRCLTTYPYQAYNELSRWFVRTSYAIQQKIVASRFRV
jgi:glycosyl transferase family 25